MKTLEDSQNIVFGDLNSNRRDFVTTNPLLQGDPTSPYDHWDSLCGNFSVDGTVSPRQNVMTDGVETVDDIACNVFIFDNLMKPYCESSDNFDLEGALPTVNHPYTPVDAPGQRFDEVKPNDVVILQRNQKTQDIIMRQPGDNLSQMTLPPHMDSQQPMYSVNDTHDSIQMPEKPPFNFYGGFSPSRPISTSTLQLTPSGKMTPVTPGFPQPAFSSASNSSENKNSNNFLFLNKNSRGYSTIFLRRGKEQPITPPTSPDELSLVQQLRLDKPLMEVISTKHKRGSYRCAHCPKMFSTVMEYASHMDEYQIKRAYKCPFPLCPWKILGLPRRSDLRRHCAIQHKQELRSDLKKYLNLKDETYPIIECPNIYCPKTFYRRDAYNRHVSIVHERADSRFNKRLERLLMKCPKFPTEEEKIAYIKEQVNGKNKKAAKK